MGISAEEKIKKIRKIIDTNLPFEHLNESLKLSAIYNVVKGKKQDYKFWKFLDEE